MQNNNFFTGYVSKLVYICNYSYTSDYIQRDREKEEKKTWRRVKGLERLEREQCLRRICLTHSSVKSWASHGPLIHTGCSPGNTTTRWSL